MGTFPTAYSRGAGLVHSFQNEPGRGMNFIREMQSAYGDLI
jgi:hypothetical protein